MAMLLRPVAIAGQGLQQGLTRAVRYYCSACTPSAAMVIDVTLSLLTIFQPLHAVSMLLLRVHPLVLASFIS